ncbi:MAG: biotin transporter BioY [Candidatus Nealsonbacteria bacterium]
MMLKNSNAKNPILIETVLPEIKDKVLVLAKDIVLVLGFAILTGISAKLKIEISLVPLTMQTVVVLLSGALLGQKKGAASQLTYLMAGLIGLPWFSRGGGLIYILSPTFGYILGFVLAAYLTGGLVEKGWNRNTTTAVLIMLAGNIVIYIPGLLWLARFVGISKILTVGLYPFILGDTLKIFLAGLILSFNRMVFEKTKAKTL